ncbi:MAG TPA: hypothetical protein VEP90_11045 [Methylomirabilota bacterium]|nr:hypothetical protein [Methylomirabilota bacterium]
MPKIDFTNQSIDSPVRAEFRSKCAYCGEWIEEDEWIIKDEDGNWIHEEHDS